MSRSEQPLNDLASGGPSTARAPSPAAPKIATAPGYVVRGVGFLADADVTIRVTYTADAVSDYLTYGTDHRGDLYAELPVSRGGGALRIAATDQRADPHGACGLLWSNTATVAHS